MTPKEKAEELIDLYYNKIEHTISNEYLKVIKEIAKVCALIAVDEILKALPPFEYGLEFVAKIEFWNEVKQEIEKL